MRLIDADALLASLPVAWDSAVKAIEDAPTVEAAPIIRCAKCRSYNQPGPGWCEVHMDAEPADGYCHRGKPKGGAER